MCACINISSIYMYIYVYVYEIHFLFFLIMDFYNLITRNPIYSGPSFSSLLFSSCNVFKAKCFVEANFSKLQTYIFFYRMLRTVLRLIHCYCGKYVTNNVNTEIIDRRRSDTMLLNEPNLLVSYITKINLIRARNFEFNFIKRKKKRYIIMYMILRF